MGVQGGRLDDAQERRQAAEARRVVTVYLHTVSAPAACSAVDIFEEGVLKYCGVMVGAGRSKADSHLVTAGCPGSKEAGSKCVSPRIC